jgi:hypothetical protein
MCAFVALKEGENELGAIVTVIRTKCLREHGRLADQNDRRSNNYENFTPHDYPDYPQKRTFQL